MLSRRYDHSICASVARAAAPGFFAFVGRPSPGSPGAGWSILPVDAVILADLAWARIEKEALMASVAFFSANPAYQARGAYRVTAELPLRSGQFEYRIKHLFEEYDRVATENDLRALELRLY